MHEQSSAKDILKTLMKESALKKIITDMDKLTDAYVEWANHNLKEDSAYRMAARSSALKIPSTLKITKIKDIERFSTFNPRNSGEMWR